MEKWRNIWEETEIKREIDIHSQVMQLKIFVMPDWARLFTKNSLLCGVGVGLLVNWVGYVRNWKMSKNAHFYRIKYSPYPLLLSWFSCNGCSRAALEMGENFPSDSLACKKNAGQKDKISASITTSYISFLPFHLMPYLMSYVVLFALFPCRQLRRLQSSDIKFLGNGFSF